MEVVARGGANYSVNRAIGLLIWDVQDCFRVGIVERHQRAARARWDRDTVRPGRGRPDDPRRPAGTRYGGLYGHDVGRCDRSANPSKPSASYRANQACSVCRDTPTLEATCDIDRPSLITASTA